MENKENYLENFKDNIWKTRKSRINLAERLNKTAFFIKCLNIYYSCAIIVLNLIDISTNKYDFSIILLATSIILTISITFLDSQQYSQRSENIKKCYINLQKIYFEITEKNFADKRSEYYKILSETENHSIYDYYKVLIDIGEASLYQSLKYYFHILLLFILKCSSLLIPIFFVYFYCFK